MRIEVRNWKQDWQEEENKRKEGFIRWTDESPDSVNMHSSLKSTALYSQANILCRMTWPLVMKYKSILFFSKKIMLVLILTPYVRFVIKNLKWFVHCKTDSPRMYTMFILCWMVPAVNITLIFHAAFSLTLETALSSSWSFLERKGDSQEGDFKC